MKRILQLFEILFYILKIDIDAPYHFNKDGLTVDKLPIDDLVVKV
jgi:hypothetical protein